MTAPCDPEATPEQREEAPEIVLRLGDILPRVPPHLLKPGPHDTMTHVRFSVDELAEKISRGRVSVPLERLASVCPEVFRDSKAFHGEQEIQLPLQKLLEHVGLVAPKPPAPNGMPTEQLAQARAEASRIIEAASAPVAGAGGQTAPTGPTSPASAADAPKPAKAVSVARQILGLFGFSNDAKAPETAEEKPSGSVAQPSGPEPANKTAAPPPAPEPVPPGFISVRVLPIFRLLPAAVLRSPELPPADARALLPLSAIDPQLATGHVEIPIDDFIKALPENLRETVNAIPATQVWIPLDEIFQNLPADHLFHMPPLGPLPEPAAPAVQAPASIEAVPERNEGPPAEPPTPAEPVADIVVAPAPDTTPAKPPTPAEPAADIVVAPAPDPTPAEPPKPAEPVADIVVAPPPDTTPAEPASPATPPAEASAPEIESVPEPPPPPATGRADAPAPMIEPLPEAAMPLPPIPTPAEPAPPPPEAPPAPARAPWMHGLRVPPPLLFSAGAAPGDAAPEADRANPTAPPAPTPEARRTVDFLATLPGVFAAAAFVQGAVFASADFPRKPGLDALRDFMGAFVGHALGSGQALGWNRILTIACEQFHATAVVRDTHFVVALHHDRVLPTLAHDSLIAAADDLGKAEG